MVLKIQKNTDTVDIDAKCLGLNSWVVGDSLNELNTNRGLHIQIRHNGNKKTFKAANEVANLIANAPQMLDVLEEIQKLVGSSRFSEVEERLKVWEMVDKIVNKTKGA